MRTDRVCEHGGVTSAQPIFPPLLSCAVDTERHVALAGWDQPWRLFALVDAASLLAAEPGLRDQIAPEDAGGHGEVGGFAAVEQENLPEAGTVEELLAQLAWPAEVDGVALAIERIVVPPEAEKDLPEDPQEATRILAEHPDRADIRLFVAVLRDGEQACLLRQRAHDSDEDVATGTDLAPGLTNALAATLLD